MKFWSLTMLVACLVACDGAPSVTDAGVPPGFDGGEYVEPSIAAPDIPWLEDGVPEIAPPAPPVPPQLTPCPAGWREVPPEGDRVATCDPYPESGVATCPSGSAHFPGEPGCALVGSACPTGEWPADLPATDVVHVRAGEPSGGDGSQTSPFGRIGDALAAVASGGTVALSRGTYDEALVLTEPVTIRGACAAETLLTTSDGAAVAVVRAQASGVALRDLRVGDSPVLGLEVASAGWSLSADGVIVERATGFAGVVIAEGSFTGRTIVIRETRAAPDGRLGRGIAVRNAGTADIGRAVIEQNLDIGVAVEGTDSTLRLEDALVRDTESEESSSTHGWGIAVWAGASAEVARTTIDHNRDIAVSVYRTGTIRFEDTVIRDTQSEELAGTGGRAINVEQGGRVEMVRGLLEGNRDIAVFAHGSGSSVRLDHTVVHETYGRQSDALGGRGLAVWNGANAEVVRSLFERCRESGVLASGRGTSILLEDTVVRDTLGQTDVRTLGGGLAVDSGASATVLRALFERNRTFGIAVRHVGTVVRIEDVVIRDTQSQRSDGMRGPGLEVQVGASVVVVRGLFERNREHAILATAPDTHLRLEDVVVRETEASDGDIRFGRGLTSRTFATVDVVRGLFERNREVGIFSGNEATVRLEDVVVRETLSRRADGAGGLGLSVEDGSSAEVSRALFDGNHELGILVDDPNSNAQLADIVVRDTTRPDAGSTQGRGLSAQRGASAEVSRGVFERNQQMGLYANAGTLRLTDVVVRDTRSDPSDDTFGRGLNAQEGAVVEVVRGLFNRNRDLAIYVGDRDTTARFDGIVVRDTLSRESDGDTGWGLGATTGSQVAVTGSLFERNRQVGAYAFGAGTVLDLTDTVIRDTLPAECGASCPAGAGGIGVGSYTRATVTLTRFVIARAQLCGLQVVDAGSIELHDGAVTENEIGACVQVSGYPLSLLQDGVSYRGNGADIEGTYFPAPMPTEGIGEP